MQLAASLANATPAIFVPTWASKQGSALQDLDGPAAWAGTTHGRAVQALTSDSHDSLQSRPRPSVPAMQIYREPVHAHGENYITRECYDDKLRRTPTKGAPAAAGPGPCQLSGTSRAFTDTHCTDGKSYRTCKYATCDHLPRSDVDKTAKGEQAAIGRKVPIIALTQQHPSPASTDPSMIAGASDICAVDVPWMSDLSSLPGMHIACEEAGGPSSDNATDPCACASLPRRNVLECPLEVAAKTAGESTSSATSTVFTAVADENNSLNRTGCPSCYDDDQAGARGSWRSASPGRPLAGLSRDNERPAGDAPRHVDQGPDCCQIQTKADAGLNPPVQYQEAYCSQAHLSKADHDRAPLQVLVTATTSVHLPPCTPLPSSPLRAGPEPSALSNLSSSSAEGAQGSCVPPPRSAREARLAAALALERQARADVEDTAVRERAELVNEIAALQQQATSLAASLTHQQEACAATVNALQGAARAATAEAATASAHALELANLLACERKTMAEQLHWERNDAAAALARERSMTSAARTTAEEAASAATELLQRERREAAEALAQEGLMTSAAQAMAEEAAQATEHERNAANTARRCCVEAADQAAQERTRNAATEAAMRAQTEKATANLERERTGLAAMREQAGAKAVADLAAAAAMAEVEGLQQAQARLCTRLHEVEAVQRRSACTVALRWHASFTGGHRAVLSLSPYFANS